MRGLDLLKKAAVLCLLALLTLDAAAQNRSSDSESTSLSPLDRLRQRVNLPSTATVPLEGAIDPAAYVVGPGDLFQVSIGGAEPVLVTLPVTAEGVLALPDAGSISVAGLSLAEARERAVATLRTRFRNVGVDVSLAQPRQFYIHVSGAVPAPGRYLATSVARVSDVLAFAFADTTQAAVSNRVFRPSLRNVQILRRDGTRRSIDLLRYFAIGDTDANLYLQDGDVVQVPAYNPDVAAVFVNGDIAFPGTYDYRPGDTIQDLLALTAGETTLGDLGDVRLARRGPEGAFLNHHYAASELIGGAPVPVEPLDHLSVAPRRLDAGTATVEGWALYPGTYPIQEGITTLKDLIEMAGGLRDEALARGAYLERRLLPPSSSALPAQNRFEMGAARPRLLRADTLALLHQMRLADFDLPSRLYFSREARLQNRVSLDLEDLLQSDDRPIPLQDGDRLVIPRDEQTVFVFGQVTRPGYVAYKPQSDASAYLTAAGGRGPLAAEAYVIEAGTGRTHPLQNADVRSGDMIFVNRRADIVDTAEMQQLMMNQEQMLMNQERLDLERRNARNDARLRVAQIALQIIGTAATVYTTYLFLNQEPR